MPRTATPAVVTALQAPLLRPAIFVEANFTTGPVYVWSGLGSITWNGQTWTGVGSLGSISTIEDGASVEARGTSITLSGLDPTLLADTLSDYQQGLPVTIWLGLFDSTGTTLIPDPIIAFSGRMDQPSITVSGDTAAITINCENRLLDLNVSVERRYTNEDQQLDYPGDRGFEFVNAIQNITIYWGRHPGGNNLNFGVQGTSGG